MNKDMLPLYNLITLRMKELGLSKAEFVRSCGYENTSKGLRKLDALWDGQLHGETTSILAAMPAALQLDPTLVQSAIRESEDLLERSRIEAQAATDARWRASFQPEAYLIGTASRPSQISIYGMTGGPRRWLRILLDLTKPPVTFASQALAVVRRTSQVPFFGPPTGFVVNYTPDTAVHFDLEGQPVKALDRAYDPAEVSLKIGSRQITKRELGKLMGWPDDLPPIST